MISIAGLRIIKDMIGVGFRLELYFNSQKIHSSLPNYKTSTDTPEFVLAVMPFFTADPPFFNRLT